MTKGWSPDSVVGRDHEKPAEMKSPRGFLGLSDVKMNALALYTNMVVLAVVGLFVNPTLVRYLGEEKFGIWKAALRFLDLTAVADGRATQALKWVIARRDADEDGADKKRAIGAALAIWCIWLPILLLGLTCLLVFLPNLINGISPANLPLARIAVAILGANMILTAFLGIPDATLVGSNQGWRSYILTTLFLVAANISMVVACYLGFGLVGVVSSTLACSILNGFATYMVVRQRISWWGVSLPQWSEIRNMLGFSNFIIAWQFVQIFMISSEVLLISSITGAAMTAQYVFFAYVNQFALSICQMTGSAVTPRMAALVGAGDKQAAAQMLFRARQLLLCIITVLAGGIILCNKAFIGVWVGEKYYLGDHANIMMALILVQYALLRFDAQVQDISMKIARKVAWGAICALTSFVLAGLFYSITKSIPALFLGLFLGRLPLNFIYRHLVGAVIPPWASYKQFYAKTCILLLTASAICLVADIEGLAGFFLAGITWLLLSASFLIGPKKLILFSKTRNLNQIF